MIATIDSAWDEAFIRAESYLRAWGVESRLDLSRVVAEIVSEACAQSLADPHTPPVALAMRLTHQRIARWGRAVDFTRVGPGPAITLSPMVPEPLEFGWPDPVSSGLLLRALGLPARTLMTWSLIVGFFGVAWVASH